MGRCWASRRAHPARGEMKPPARRAAFFVFALLMVVTAVAAVDGVSSHLQPSRAVALPPVTSPSQDATGPADSLAERARRETNPRVSRGLLDVAGVDLTEVLLPLDGEWEFYWGQLYEPEAFADAAAAPPPAYFSVPGGWNKVAGGTGVATYRLRIRGFGADEPLGLYVPFVPTSYALWVNGRLAASRGVVASQRVGAVPAAGTSLVVIEPDAPEIEIVLQVANFAFREGGMTRSLIFGTYENVRAGVRRYLVLDSFFVASLLFIGLYHLGLWITRRQARELLWFGLLSLAVGLRMTVMDQAPVTLFFPEIAWEALIKVEYIGFYVAVPLFVLFLRDLFPEEFAPRPVRAVAWVGAAFSLFVLVTPARIHSHLLPYYQTFTMAVIAFVLWALGRSVKQRRTGSRAILAAVVVAALAVVNDTLFHWGYLRLGEFAPTAVLGVLVAHSFLMSKQFSDEFARQKELVEEKRVLLEIVQQQVEQIRNSRRKMHAREEQVRRSVAELLHGTVQSRLLLARHHLRKGIRLLEEGPRRSGAQADDAILCNLNKADEEIEYIGRTEIRNISHLLHPMLLRLGLVPALKSMGERFNEHFDVEIHVSDTWPLGEGAAGKENIDESLLLTVYRIVEEALANAMKHARASKVDIYLNVEAGSTLTVAVRDNGIGWKGSIPPDGFGFGFGMISARVEDAGGSWEITSEPGRGTRLFVRLPIEADEDGGAADETRAT